MESPKRVEHPQSDSRVFLGRRLALLSMGGVCVVAFLLLQAVALHTVTGQHYDQRLMEAINIAQHPLLALPDQLLRASVLTAAGVLVVTTLVLLVRRNTAWIAQVILLFAGANVTTQVCKHFIFERPVLLEGVGNLANSFPSGHVTLTCATVVTLLISLDRTRAVSLCALVGLVWVALVGAGTLSAAWHRPSDVLGAVLVVLAWVCIAKSVFPARNPQ